MSLPQMSLRDNPEQHPSDPSQCLHITTMQTRSLGVFYCLISNRIISGKVGMALGIEGIERASIIWREWQLTLQSER